MIRSIAVQCQPPGNHNNPTCSIFCFWPLALVCFLFLSIRCGCVPSLCLFLLFLINGTRDIDKTMLYLKQLE